MSATSPRALAFFSLFAGVALAGTCHAQLVFERKEADLKAGLADTQVVARYPFRNAGKRTIHILEISTSCGCTTAALEKRTYAPGEKGEITAAFTVGSQMGLQDKSIFVETDDRKAPVITLDMRIAIANLLEVKPAALYWAPGDARSPKEITVKVSNELPVGEVTVLSSDPNVKTRITPVAPGKEYTVEVTPGGSATDALITVSADYPPGTPRYFYTRARVR